MCFVVSSSHCVSVDIFCYMCRNSWGTYWGELGFFKIERGTNALQLEAGDCWWAVPTWKDEKDVRDGKLVGTMWGVFTPEEASKMKPEAGTKPHEDGASSSLEQQDTISAAAASSFTRVKPF